jgi:serine/threonine protein kinase
MENSSPFEHLEGLENDYDQIQKIAIGGMAEVYRGRQKSLDRPVAIKRMRAELRGSRDLQERFRREARSAANLLHHNLAHVYDYKVVGSEAYIIMEYIDGFDLAQILERSGPMPVDVATMIAVKILQGLTQVHSHGMIHRDIKPDNIRVNMRGEVKIMDFGIALDPGELNLTQPGILIGSPHYLAPEQILGDKLDQRADIFAFGITFYEMLTGKRPFSEKDGQTVYAVIKSGKYEKITQVRPDVPAYIANVVEKCLRVKAADRYASTEVIAQSLQEFLMSHHSLAFEQRLRKFLMEKQLIKGNPSLIEVQEKTLPPQKRSFFNFSKKQLERLVMWGMILALLGAALFTDVFEKLRGRMTPDATDVEEESTTSEASAKAADTKESRPSKPKPRTRQVPTTEAQLPGMPVED